MKTLVGVFRTILSRARTLAELKIVWLSIFGVAAIVVATCLLVSDRRERILWMGILFQWVGVGTVAWGLADTRRRLFKKPSLIRVTWDAIRRFWRPQNEVVSATGAAVGVTVANARLFTRSEVKGSVDEKINALEKNQMKIDEELGKLDLRVAAINGEIIANSKKERTQRLADENAIRELIEKAVVGGISLSFAGVFYLIIGIAFSTVPDDILWVVQFVRSAI